MELKCPRDGGLLTPVETLSHGSEVTVLLCAHGHTLDSGETPIQVRLIDTDVEVEKDGE